MNHPNIVGVYDVGQQDGRAYIVSEMVDGESLRKTIERGPLPARKLLDIAIQIADAIAAAHAPGIVHRDLKPENIMITRDNRVKVLDFGLAKQKAVTENDATVTMALSQPGTVMGTVGYMSPEQVRGEIVDHRSDIFGFGCVLHELETGKAAFNGQSAADVMSAILKEEPAELTGAPGLDAITRRCLEKNPSQRFQSRADLAFALRSLSNPSVSHPATAVASPARRKWAVILAFIDGRSQLLERPASLLFAIYLIVVSAGWVQLCGSISKISSLVAMRPIANEHLPDDESSPQSHDSATAGQNGVEPLQCRQPNNVKLSAGSTR